ncbi:MAG: hypothetical protein ACREER_13450 [Alphaproteobacteria bacterium]
MARPRSESLTGALTRGLVVLVIAVVVGGTVFLATWEIPAPTATIETVLPDDRFPG